MEMPEEDSTFGATMKDEPVATAPDKILKRLILSEKTAFLAEASNVYTFEVPLDATKTEVKQAVEEAFSVKVVRVNSITRQGHAKRYRAHIGITAERKRMLVKLDPEDRISIY